MISNIKKILGLSSEDLCVRVVSEPQFINVLNDESSPPPNLQDIKQKGSNLWPVNQQAP